MTLISRDDWWWPAADTQAHRIIPEEAVTAVPWFVRHCDRFGRVVQAGGNTGWYARELRKHFKHVLTVEPDADNMECLARNMVNGEGGSVALLRGALWSESGPAKLHVNRAEQDNCGAHRTEASHPLGFGGPWVAPADAYAVDDLALDNCDALWLDVEGAELPALHGARATIEKFRPVIAYEAKGLGRHFGYSDDTVDRFLRSIGYEFISSEGNDRLYTYAL